MERTLSIIKPDGVKKNVIGEVIRRFEADGIKVTAMKMIQLTKTQAQGFYAVHKERPFFDSLTDFMTSGPIVAAILEKDNAVDDFRKLIGATNPENAEEGTLRKSFAESVQYNAVHGSDSDENAIIESNFHFAETERY